MVVELLVFVQEQRIRPVIGREFDWKDAKQAFEHSIGWSGVGKIVIKVGDWKGGFYSDWIWQRYSGADCCSSRYRYAVRYGPDGLRVQKSPRCHWKLNDFSTANFPSLVLF